MLTRAWIGAARARRALDRARRRTAPREELVARHVAGRSFADVGCMWGVDGAIAFAAEQAGAARVTAIDMMEPTPAFEATRAQRNSNVRFLLGDIHDPATVRDAGVHDVVWCSGIVYHVPHPLLTLQRLRAMTGELLLLASETLPELPGLSQGCVFLPGLPARQRRILARARRGAGEQHGITTEFDPARGYGNWYWGLTHSALAAMLAASGFEPLEITTGNPFHATFVARPVPGSGLSS